MRSNYRQLIFSFAWVTVLFISAQAQDTCPTLSVTGPGGVVAPGDLARYQLNITPLGRGQPLTFNWTISAGTIKAGQGTDRIDVLQPARCITATVEIKGLPLSCPYLVSEVSCGDPMPRSEKLVEITGALTKNKVVSIEKALHWFQVDRNAMAYVVIYTRRKRDVRKK